MKLIGLVGSAGSGKNAFAEEFHYHSFKEFAFADPLKSACAELFGIPLTSFNDRVLKEREDPFWKVSPREIAQFVGTELIRANMAQLITGIGSDFWVQSLKYTLHKHEVESFATGEEFKAVITDVRFPNELNFILSLGGHICHLTRPDFDGTVGIQSHQSEVLASNFRSTYLESSQIHYIDNAGTLDDLKLKAHAFVNVVMK